MNLSGLPCDSGLPASDAALAVDSDGTVYVIWDQVQSGFPYNEVYLIRSSDSGATFSEPKNVSHSPQTWFGGLGAILPDVAAGPAGHVYVAWQDRTEPGDLPQIFFALSTDGGETFSAPLQVSFTQEPELYDSSFPHTFADLGDPIYVGWKQGGAVSFQEFVAHSLDGGASFSTTLLAHAGSYSGAPHLAVGPGGTLLATWGDARRIFLKTSTDQGQTFSKKKRLSSRERNALPIQRIAASETGHVYVVWLSTEVGDDIIMTYSLDGGQTWPRRFNVSGPIGYAAPDVAADPLGNAYVVFAGELPPPGTGTGIYFMRTLEPLQ
jgi:hypothetical protein